VDLPPISIIDKKKPTETAVGVGWEDYFLTKVLMQLLDQSSLQNKHITYHHSYQPVAKPPFIEVMFDQWV